MNLIVMIWMQVLSELLKLNNRDTRESVSIGKGRPGVKARMADFFREKNKIKFLQKVVTCYAMSAVV